MEEVIDPSLTIKAVGHQWYWSYECSDFEVAPKVTGENLELIEKSVKNLKDPPSRRGEVDVPPCSGRRGAK